MKFHKRLSEILFKRELNQLRLSEKTGLSTATLSNMVSGKNSPSWDKVEKLLPALNYEDALYLIFGEIKNVESNILNDANEPSTPYTPNPHGQMERELAQLRKRVEELEKWKDRVTSK